VLAVWRVSVISVKLSTAQPSEQMLVQWFESAEWAKALKLLVPRWLW